MNKFTEVIAGWGVNTNLLLSVGLLVIVWAMRRVALMTIRKWNAPTVETRRNWIVQIRNMTVLMIVSGLFLIWATELKEFAMSVLAIAVAFVIATKEMTACVLGGIFKYSGRIFSVGDRVEIGELRGDVISHNFLVTTIYEIGPGKDMHQFTGRMIVVPNSVFLTTPVINETETGQYSLHVFRVPFLRTDPWKEAATKLLAAANQECAGYVEAAKSEFEQVARKEGLEIPKVDPRVQITYPDKDRIDVVVRMPVPARAKGKIEQAVLMQFEGGLLNTD